jgi:hypothetical protein
VVVCDLEVAAYVEAGWHGGCWFGGLECLQEIVLYPMALSGYMLAL